MKLTDNIILEIEQSKDPSLESARKIIKRIRNRDLYKFVWEILINPNESKNNKINQLDGNQIKEELLKFY
jgi:hypothetical protein